MGRARPAAARVAALRELTPDVCRPLPARARGRRGRARVDPQDADAAPGRAPARVSSGTGSRRTRSRAVRKPPAGRARAVRPLAPETVEAMRDWLLRRGCVRDATLVSVLAYAGPAAGRGARSDAGRTSASARCSSRRRSRSASIDGDEDAAGARTVRAARAAGAGPRRVAAARRPPDDDALVFPGHDGRPWTLTAYKNWRRRSTRRRPRRPARSVRARTTCATRSCRC